MHNEIDSIIDPGVRKREVIAIDTVIDAVSGRVREIHDKPPLSRSSEFRDNTKSADMESRKRRPGKRTSDHGRGGLRETSTRPRSGDSGEWTACPGTRTGSWGCGTGRSQFQSLAETGQEVLTKGGGWVAPQLRR